MKIIAVIPARSGSKRLPLKNLISFKGRPIIEYTLDAAKRTGCFETVVVSTEDDRIAAVSKANGVRVIPRPRHLATDTAGVVDVCLHALDEEMHQGRNYDLLCCLYATAPLRTAEDIRLTMAPVIEEKCEFSMALSHYHFAPHQALRTGPDGCLQAMWPDLIGRRSQDVPELLVDNGSTYVVSVPEFRRQKTFYGSRLSGHVMPRRRSVDIDDPEDLQLANLLYGEGLTY